VVEELLTSSSSVHDNFSLSQSEFIDGNVVLNESRNVFNGLGEGDVVKLRFGAGTDGTGLKS